MTHYWGAKAICDRIGYRNTSRLPELIIKYHVPAYKRHHPFKRMLTVYYSNEEMLSRWDLARAQHVREDLIAKQEAKSMARAEKKNSALRGSLK
jgi:hypothetical protein